MTSHPINYLCICIHVFNIIIRKAAIHHIRMIFEGSCDAENSALITGITYILKYITIEKLF